MTLPRFEVEVLSQHEGRAVVRIAGRKMPLLILDVNSIAELEDLFAAAALRIGTLGDAAASDAITQFMHTFRTLVAEFDIERKRYGTEMLERKDHGDVLKEFERDLNALRGPADDVPK